MHQWQYTHADYKEEQQVSKAVQALTKGRNRIQLSCQYTIRHIGKPTYHIEQIE